MRYDWTERSAVYINMLFTHVVFKIANVGILRFSFAVDGRKVFLSVNRTCSTLIIFAIGPIKFLICGVVIAVAARLHTLQIFSALPF